MKELPARKHPRLKGYDYSKNGAYFITFCVKDKCELLGQIVVGRGILDAPFVELSKHGKALTEAIDFLNSRGNGIDIVKYVIMPNHVHLIVQIDVSCDGASGMPRPTDAVIPKLVSSIKRYTNKQAGINLWQQSYHDRIIRDESEYQRIWQYIENNPITWIDDIYFSM